MAPWRKAFSLLLLYALAIEVVSGIVLYMGPLPRVASTMGWSLWGLTKPEWDGLHTIFGYVMLVAGVFHLLLNGRAIMGYIRCRMRERITRSFIFATVLTLLVGVGTVARWEPFNWTLNYGESLRRAWAAEMLRQRTDLLPPAMREMMLRRLEQGRAPSR